MPSPPTMPSDWDDHAGWESYFTSLRADQYWFDIATTRSCSFRFEQLGELIDELRERNQNTLWFPGCGFSPLPRAFASFGFVVHATDIAPSAIAYQHVNEAIVALLSADISVTRPRAGPGVLNARLHDFRTTFGSGDIDVVFNIRAFQGLPYASMRLAGQSHHAALRPGGTAFFDTMNVQGERRNILETALSDAGFYIPLRELTAWFRDALARTGIPHIFVLGAPMIRPRNDMPYPHASGSPGYERDKKILRDITEEYRSRMKTEHEREQLSVTAETKTAHIIYSTG